MQTIRLCALALVGCCLAGCGIPTLDTVILRPSPTLKQTPVEVGFDYEQATLHFGDKRQIVVWLIRSQESKALFCVLPGSDANKSRYLEALPILVPNGYDVLLMDYEGFGDSPGSLSLYGVLENARVVTQYAHTLHDNVFLYSVSLGTPLGAQVATEQEFVGVIFEGTLNLFRLPELWLKDNFFLPIPFFWHAANFWTYPQIPGEYEITDTITRVEEPKFFMHSVEDEVTPIAGAREVFDLASEPKEFWEMRHEHGRMVSEEPELYGEMLVDWLDRTLAGASE
jgi:hypothetical protein